jgi:hypothetical protein
MILHLSLSKKIFHAVAMVVLLFDNIYPNKSCLFFKYRTNQPTVKYEVSASLISVSAIGQDPALVLPISEPHKLCP